MERGKNKFAMESKHHHQRVQVLAVVLVGIFVVAALYQQAHRHRSRAARHFAKVHHLEGGGYCYNDGSHWWYYDTVLTDSGGVYSPRANSWAQSAKSPEENNLKINAAKDASDPEEVEIGAQDQPEQSAISEAEAQETENQVNDMVNEGNPNNQDMAESEGGSEGGGEGGAPSQASGRRPYRFVGRRPGRDQRRGGRTGAPLRGRGSR